MSGHDFDFCGARLSARGSGALWWAARGLLCVSDLHFGKAERIARQGGALLPPFDTAETLERLEAEVAATAPDTVVCLGDSFDDPAAGSGLTETHRLRLLRLMAGRRWVWIAGNHDPGPPDLAGTHLARLEEAGLTFRHVAQPGAAAEVSGHYHPAARLTRRGLRLRRPCFLIDARRIILPAFGAYTGGLDSDAPELAALMQPGALAVLTGARVLVVPMPRR